MAERVVHQLAIFPSPVAKLRELVATLALCPFQQAVHHTLAARPVVVMYPWLPAMRLVQAVLDL